MQCKRGHQKSTSILDSCDKSAALVVSVYRLAAARVDVSAAWASARLATQGRRMSHDGYRAHKIQAVLDVDAVMATRTASALARALDKVVESAAWICTRSALRDAATAATVVLSAVDWAALAVAVLVEVMAATPAELREDASLATLVETEATWAAIDVLSAALVLAPTDAITLSKSALTAVTLLAILVSSVPPGFTMASILSLTSRTEYDLEPTWK